MQINPKRLRKRLQWLAWEGGLTRVTLYGVSDTHSAHKLLRAYKSLISCVQVTHPDTQAPVHIILYGWPLTDSVFRALKSLPQWCKVEGSTLDLCACSGAMTPCSTKSMWLSMYRVRLLSGCWETHPAQCYSASVRV